MMRSLISRFELDVKGEISLASSQLFEISRLGKLYFKGYRFDVGLIHLNRLLGVFVKIVIEGVQAE